MTTKIKMKAVAIVVTALLVSGLSSCTNEKKACLAFQEVEATVLEGVEVYGRKDSVCVIEQQGSKIVTKHLK